MLGKRKAQIREGKFFDIERSQKAKLEDFGGEFLRIYCKTNKRSWRRDKVSLQHLTAFFPGKYLHEIRPLTIEEYRLEKLRKVTRPTINRELVFLRTLFTKAIGWGKFNGENPLKKIKFFPEKSRKIRFLEKEEIEKLVDNCATHLKPIVILALNTGMRKGELLSLKWPEVDFKRKMLYVTQTKNNRIREINLNQAAFQTSISIEKNKQSAYVFCHEDGEPFGDVQTAFTHALRRAGIKNCTFHTLRHTCASWLVMTRVDLRTVQGVLGHSDLRMTERYAHLSRDHKARAVEQLDKHWFTKWPQRQKSDILAKSRIPYNVDS